MDIREALLKEHSKAQCRKIVEYIGDDKKKFAELMRLFLGDEYRVIQRAAWPLSYCVGEHPEFITPYFEDLLGMLQKPGVHNAVIRNTTRLLQNLKIPKKIQGRLMTICFDFISDINTPPAVKAFSLTILDNLSKDYPEIASELKLVIEERWEHESAAFRSRGKKILQKMN